MSDKVMQGAEVVRGHVLPQWIDVNNHMNVAYYVLAFDQGVDTLWGRFGLTEEYVQSHGGGAISGE